MVKPVNAQWIIRAVEHITSLPSQVKSGFKRAEILKCAFPDFQDKLLTKIGSQLLVNTLRQSKNLQRTAFHHSSSAVV